MFSEALWWLLLNIFTIVVLAFFSMEEMACISFNKIRLQFYVSEGSKRAQWLYFLMQNPARLFGTTLIGVNVATFVGSECSRQFHVALGLNPDWAPLSQVLIVIIFGELAPQFAARSFPEHVALLGAPFLYFSSQVLAPFIWVLGWMSRLANHLVGGEEPRSDLFLTSEELQKIVESQEDEPLHSTSESEEVSVITANIFNLREKTAKTAMDPLENVFLLPFNMPILQAHKQIPPQVMAIPLYHKERTNIMGIAFIRDLIKAPPNKRIRDYSSSPWFIRENIPLMQIMKQFRQNNETVAVVLNEKGQAVGILSLDHIIEEIFGEKEPISAQQKQGIMIDRTLPGSMTIEAFNQEFSADLPFEEEQTLSGMMISLLEHTPEKGESVWIPPYEFTIKETSLLEIKTVSVKTKVT